MTSRYALYDIAELSGRFTITEGLPKGVKLHYNNSPTKSAPVIINDNGTAVVKLMKWGFVPKGAKDTNAVFRYKTYNIPSEKIFSRHSWESAVRERRCLVPANGFYELNRSGKKRAYYATLKDESLFAFAGVYSSWQDPEGTTHGIFSVITTEANSDMPDARMRMPIVIKREDEARWLDPTISDANSLYDMLRPNPSGIMKVYEVSPAVHSPKPDSPELIQPL
jgi:putative SOS response-associated peptidase YedK